MIYGGGGIRPDAKVESDTTHYSTYYANLIQRGVVQQTVNDYLDQERTILKEQYGTLDHLLMHYNVPESLIDEVKAQGERASIPYVEAEFERSKMLLTTQLKALIAQRLYGAEGFYRVMNPTYNEAYIEAMKLIDKQ